MPVERFPSQGPDDNPQDYDFALLNESLKRVLAEKGLNVLRVDGGEADQTLTQFEVFTVGQTEQDATTMVLIGNEELRSDRVTAHGMDRPHKIISPQDIIDSVKLKYQELKQAGFDPYKNPSSQPHLA